MTFTKIIGIKKTIPTINLFSFPEAIQVHTAMKF